MASSVDNYTTARKYLDDLFKTSDPHASCLSVVSHDLKDVRDLRCHFFGCLGIDKRVEVLHNADHPIWTQAEELENENTDPQFRKPKNPSRRRFEEDNDDVPYDMRYITALNLQADLKRIAVLRRTPALKGLVREVRDSINKWRRVNRENIDMVGELRVNSHSWDKSNHLATPRNSRRPRDQTLSFQDTPSAPRAAVQRQQVVEGDSRRPELDEILPEFSQKLQDVIEEFRNKELGEPEPEESPAYDLKRDIKARLIKLQRPRPTDSDSTSLASNVMGPSEVDIDAKIFKGSFPDQQLSVHYLLNGMFKRHPRPDDDGGSAKKAFPDEMSYYHIPVNNMSWVEEAIASYFGETAPLPGESFQSCPRTRLVLQDWCWRGQEHGGGPGSVVHTRNLRPICEKISTDAKDVYQSGESTQNGVVLFMPYLHWETDRRRNQVANLIEQLADEHDLDKRETAKMWKSKRVDDRKGLEVATNSPASAPPAYKEPDYYRARGKDRDRILEALAKLLWAKIGDGIEQNMPQGLPHALWQNIRDNQYDNKLLVALENVIGESAKDSKMDPILKPLVFERHGEGTVREWRDILWAIKKAGRGFPTPHALEDIFWEEIKKARMRADNQEKSRSQCDGEVSAPQTKVFKQDTTIFKGVHIDEYGYLKPRNNLAKVLVIAARLYEEIMTYPDQRIMEEYLFKYPPLHPRRTLDQAYFWRLRNTRLRDRDQVIYRYTNAEFAHKYRPQPPSDPKNDRSSASVKSSNASKGLHGDHTHQENWVWTRHGQYEEQNGCDQCEEDIRKVSRAIMVDQLWMWILDNDTILTCFPQRYGLSDKDPSGVHQSIRTRVKTRNNTDNQIRSIFDLALIILDECFSTFFNKTKTSDKRPQVMDMFAESIGRVTNKQAIAFKHLWTLSKRLTDIYQSGVVEKVDPNLLLALLNVTHEAELQREIRDIIDELDIILHIAKQQQEMIKRFVKFALEIIDPDASRHKAASPYDETHSEQYTAFTTHSEDLLSEIKDRITELSGLKSSAESTAQNVNDLLGLKQQQASVVQAYEAMKQGEETVRQGKAIMVFTVMTIIFLPLSFLSSVFGMNAVELTGNDPSPGAGSSNSSGPVPDEIVPFYPTTFKRQIMIMFTVSFGVVLAVIIPAFSPFIRASIGSAFNQSMAKMITSTGLYKLWLKSGLKSKNVRDGAWTNVSKMKKNVCEEVYHQTLIRSEVRDRVRDSNGKLLTRETNQVCAEGARVANGTVGTTTNGAAGNGVNGVGEQSPDVEKGLGR